MTGAEDVRRIALTLPEAWEKSTYGTPGFFVRKKLFGRIRDDSTELAVWREGEDEKEALIESEPDKFFTTPHYDGYAMVLVRLPAIDTEELEDLLIESWLIRAPKRLASEFLNSREP